MLFDLLAIRVKHAFQIKALTKFRLRHDARKVKHEEQGIEQDEKALEQQLHGGVIEDVQTQMHKLLEKDTKHVERILHFEENDILWIYRTFKGFVKELHELNSVEDEVKKRYGHFSPQTQKRVSELFKKILLLVREDAQASHEILKHFARVFRDQYDALFPTEKGEDATVRLRDEIVGVPFKEFMERMKISSTNRAAKSLKKDYKQEKKIIDRLEDALKHTAEAVDEQKFLQALENLEKVLEEESEHIKEFLKNNRVFLLLMVRHFFTSLDHLKTVYKDNMILREEKFPKVEELEDRLKKSFEELQKHTNSIMKEEYQLLNKFDKLLGNEVKSVQKAA